jgi:beta-fructofuranosidase
MNDPNGLFVDSNGTWHLYYQYDPTADVAGNQHWGHATSTDLYTWINQPIALWPPNDFTFIYSGSAVVDTNNTSGFFPDQDNGVVAIFTLAQVIDGVGGLQAQGIAYSYDGGYSFDMYSGNPVLNINSTQFRDPKVFWFPGTQRWIMAVSYASDFTIGIFTSPNLKDWTHASNFSHHGLLGFQYECPNLVEMPVAGSNDTMWLMFISINPGAPLGGSISQYFPGSFNGTHFSAIDQVARIADFAKDNYAAQFFEGIPESQPQIRIDWSSNWQYAESVPTGTTEGWRSCMSVPHETYLEQLPGVGWTLVSRPYNISSQFLQELAYNANLENGTMLLDYSQVSSGAIYFEANITGLNPNTLFGTVNFTFTSSLSGENVQGGTMVNGITWISRHNTLGFDNPYFTDKFSSNGVYSGSQDGSWTVSGVLDHTILEIFVNGGQQSATMIFFPTRPLDMFWIGANAIPDSATVSVAVWALQDAWATQENFNGTVVGNVTGV